MTRFALRGHPVLYLGCTGFREWTSARHAARTIAREAQPGINLSVINTPFSPYARHGIGLRNRIATRFLRTSYHKWLDRVGNVPLVLWLYHPMLLQMASDLNPSVVVYDVMDRFEAFHKGHPLLPQVEADLASSANVVFAGGRSLHAAVRAMAGPNVHCYASGVDLDHFARSRMIPRKHEGPDRKPRLGYAGAIDERVDFDLLIELAGLRPDWEIRLVGPVLQRPAQVPPNLLFPGPVKYSELPEVLAQFDVCLLPFRTTRLVQHISPTKTPEYLAAGKPVVSTHIPDVEADYAGVVQFALNAREFVVACERLMAAPPDPGGLAGIAAERARTWEQIAFEMEALVATSLERSV